MKTKITLIIALVFFFASAHSQDVGQTYEPVSGQSTYFDVSQPPTEIGEVLPKEASGHHLHKETKDVSNLNKGDVSVLNAQDRQPQADNLFPEDVFRYDQVLPPTQIPDHKPECENYLLDVMFSDEARVRLRDGQLTDLETDATAGMNPILDKLPWYAWERFSEVAEEVLDELSENGSRNTSQPVYNLNNIYRLRVPEQKNIWELGISLESLPGIIYARPVPKPAELPVPPNYIDNQGYLNPAEDIPSGIDAEYAWTRSGGIGTGIKICDLEYSWNYNHADVTKAVGSQINSNVADPFSSTHHGTAVIGVLVSNNNGWGTTGASYNSSLRTCGTYYGSPSPSYNPGGAITLSIANLVAGDIILLEQQADYTGSQGYVPIEWYGNYSPNAQTNNPVYAAIVNAVANGIHVVEAGGNGNINTGNMTWFGNSGAVIVGAGGGYAASNLKKLGFSSYGPRFDVQGWGENVTTTGYGSLYSAEGINYYYTSTFNGTSSASPTVTSAIACFSGFWKSNISATPPTPANMRAILKRHGRPQVNPGDGYIGSRPNLEAMIKGYMYCAASGGCDEYISRVQMGTIDNSSACDGGYVDYTSIYSTQLPLNLSQTLTVTNGNPYGSDQCGVWVDWNRDGDFSDANETIAVSGTPGSGPYTATITPPATATLGEVRMRVRITYTGTVSACGSTTFGEVEDYTINLTTKAPNVWTGAFNYYWHNANNWSLGHIPTADEDVIMTSAGLHPPSVAFYDESCNNLTIESGAGLIIAEKNLVVNGDLDISGNLSMNNASGVLTVMGNVAWQSGSTAGFSANAVFWVHGNWNFNLGANANLANGYVDFTGNNTSWIRQYSTNSSFNIIGIYKSGTNWARISDLSTQPLTINGSVFIQPSCNFGISSSNQVILKGSLFNNGYYDFTGASNTGTFVFDGTSQQINHYGVGTGLFNNVRFSSSTGTTALSNINVAENLTIDQGFFSPGANTVSVGGNWNNMLGPDAFVEGTGTVSFDGEWEQECSTEIFNVLILNKPNGDLNIPSGANVECQSYRWLGGSGEIRVFDASFTAWDLFDNGIQGFFFLSHDNAVVNLYQDNGQWIDLNGRIRIDAGTMNVYGGSGVSFWPYTADADLWLYGGTLNFADNGIYINGSSTYNLDVDITGGTIKTAGGFYGNSDTFQPSGGEVELYGSGDAIVGIDGTSYFHDLIINKAALDNSTGTYTAKPSKGQSNAPEREEPIPGNTRSNTATAAYNIAINHNLIIENGVFDVATYDVTADYTTDIYATLKMMHIDGSLTTGTLNWQSGSEDIIDAGNIYCNIWNFKPGTLAQLGTGNVAHVYYGFNDLDEGGVIGNLEMGFSGSKFTLPENRGNALNTAGYATLLSGSDWYFSVPMNIGTNFTVEETAKFSIYDNLTVDGDLILPGEIVFNGDLTLIHGAFSFPATGSLTINGGDFILDAPNHPDKGWEYIDGNLEMASGLFEITNNSTYFGASATTFISGGIIRSGGAFAAIDPGVFEPTGGTVEIIGDVPDLAIYCYGGNYFYNLLINRAPGYYCQFAGGNAVSVLNDLSILSGSLNTGTSDMFVGGNWANYVGPDGFVEGTGTVTFNGNWGQDCSAEEFYNLVLNKPTGDLQLFDGQTVTCQTYQWLSGEIHVASGTFTAYDLNENGVFGEYFVDGVNATINLYQDAGQWTDLNSSIFITDGAMNIYGGSGPSYWPFSSNAILNLSGGVLDFHDIDIFLNGTSTYTLNTNITGGLIRTEGGFYGNGSEFSPTGGSVELYGDISASVGFDGTSNFHNLIVNKTAPKNNANPTRQYIDREGKEVIQTRGTDINAAYDLTIDGDLIVEAGTFSLNGFSADINNDVTVGDGGILNADENAQLLLSGLSVLNVESGGLIELLGTSGNEAAVSHTSGYYDFNILSGGTISADHAIFEYMGTVQGIHIANGALVDPVNCFNNCTFRNGNAALVNEALITIDNAQTFTTNFASFPTSGTNYNVAKTLNQGRVTFKDFSGIFSGEAFDLDTYNRIDWFTPQLSASPLTLNVNPPAGTAIINVTSNLAWTATESSPWFSISPLSGTNNGTITVTYNQNTSASGRSGTITLSAPDVPNVIVTVNQAGATLSVTPATRSVSAPAGSTTFSVGSNTSWTVSESVSWFSVSPMSGTANGTLTVNYNQNTSTTPRSGQITVSSTGLPSVVVTVNQAGAGATLTVTPANRNVPPEAGVTSFSITSNTNWTVSESVAWFNVSPMSGTANGTLTVNYGQNTTGSPRVGSILVTASGGSPAVTVTVSQSAYSGHIISLSAGWQGLSSYLMPVNNDIVDVFNFISGQLIIAATLTEMYYPAGPVNTIIDWESQSAYKVKMNAAASLTIIGNPETNKSFALASGWSLVPVICNVPVEAAPLFAPTSLAILKDVAGTGVYWPEFAINTIGFLQPGEAYLAKLNSAATVVFPANAKEASDAEVTVHQFPDHPWNQITVSPASHQIAILAEGMQGVLAGDVVGVFDESDNCFGVAAIDAIDKNQVITAYANDELLNSKTGFGNGNLMQFKVYRPQTNEILNVEVGFDTRLPQQQYFQAEGLSAISVLKVSAVGMAESTSESIGIYPNPTTGVVTLSGIAGYSDVHVISAGGNVVRSVSIDNAGQITIDLSAMSSGIYQLHFIGKELSVYKKLILN